ncbi:MAG: hypothetical protein KC729_13125 [Candidatus Eisenbacteria bacterium]|uniref:PEP-CTERM sorting domain-containing protein n=1 Tax=Eiseniibacteriota bacterium TaxID=2212470 RepID=A0A956RRH9_UNCEI|nr:hypothetical protein [Candidatus Eisenbacteria bacterium]
MQTRWLLGVALSSGLSTIAIAAGENLGPGGIDPNSTPPADRSEFLFQGDLVPEFGIGCSNSADTSGGPNDAAVGVTATTTPPFVITSHFYNMGTAAPPNITQLSFVAWQGGPIPGPEIGRISIAPNWDSGDHTVSIAGIAVSSSQFYFGQNQNQTNVGIRWGVDSSSGSAGTSFIRAPACGVGQFTLLDAIGFPGNWVMAVTIDAIVPVELSSWGSVKAEFR